MKDKTFPSSLKETRQHGNFSFPCAFYQAMHENDSSGFSYVVKHHWHEQIEIIYLEEDSYQVDINMNIHISKVHVFALSTVENYMH